MPPDPSSDRPRSEYRRARRVVVGILLAIALGLAAEWLWGTVRQSMQPTGAAEWIWKAKLTRWSGPKSFYAVGDLEVDEVPREARVLVQGDEEYVLLLNGRRVGGNQYRSGDPLDEYRIERMLSPGTNRFTAHLRSSKGEGAFLLAVFFDDETEPRLVTDENWRVVRSFTRQLFRPWMPLRRGESAIVVATPPEGRWGATRGAAARPIHDQLSVLRHGVAPTRFLLEDGGWQGLSEGSSRRGGRGLAASPDLARTVVMLDFGQVLSGILALRFDDGPEVPVGLAFFGAEAPDPIAQGPDTFVIGTPNQSYWEDSVPRTFRYVLLVGLDTLTEARLVVTDPAALEPILGGQAPPGVLGRPAPRLRTPAEDKVWRELESFPSGPEW